MAPHVAAAGTAVEETELIIEMDPAGGCTCSKRAELIASGVDKLCQASYAAGTAGTYKAADCEKVSDNSGASTKCCAATFGTASTVKSADCAINSAVCTGLSNGNVYCYGRSATMLLGWATNAGNSLGFNPSDICVAGSGTASTAFASTSPIAGTGTMAWGAVGGTTSKASGNAQCTSSCVTATAAATTTAAAATTAATSATSESYMFIFGFSLFAVFAPLLK